MIHDLAPRRREGRACPIPTAPTAPRSTPPARCAHAGHAPRRRSTLLAALLLAIAACGGDDPEASAADPSTTATASTSAASESGTAGTDGRETGSGADMASPPADPRGTAAVCGANTPTWYPCERGICEHFACDGSELDGDGCSLAPCRADVDCPAGRWCGAHALRTSCAAAALAACEPTATGTCMCAPAGPGTSLDCGATSSTACMDGAPPTDPSSCGLTELSCGELLVRAEALTEAYVVGAGATAPPAAEVAARTGTCASAAYVASIERGCRSDVCLALCELSGCRPDLFTCVDECSALQATSDPEALLAAVAAVARTPKSCTCPDCGAGAALCQALWSCDG
jgi:hypothetical protein